MSKSPKRPATPKSAKPKKGGGSPGIKYGIFFINFDDKYFKPILKQFAQDLKEHERRSVLGFTRDEVVREILKEQAEKAKKGKEGKAATPKGKKGKKEEEKEDKGEKDKKGKKGKKGAEGGNEQKESKQPGDDTQKAVKPEQPQPDELDGGVQINPEMFVLDQKTFNQFYNKIKEYIDKSVKRSETIANNLKARQEFDLVKYWEEKGDQKIESKQIEGKGTEEKKDKKKKGDKDGDKSPRKRGGAEKKKKGKKDETEDEKTTEGKKEGEKKKEKESKKGTKTKKEEGEEGGVPCNLKEVKFVKLNEKIWSKIQPRIGNEPFKLKVLNFSSHFLI